MPQQQMAGSISLGIMSASQPMFLVAAQLERIPESAVGRVRSILGVLEQFEAALASSLIKQLRVNKIGGVEVRADAGDALQHEQGRWVRKLANLLGCPVNPHAEKLSGSGPRPISRPRELQ